MRHITMVVDLQFGSTGKGLLVGYLARELEPDTAIAAWGPNAGHTYIDRRGNKFVHTMLPIGAIYESVRAVLLGPGSVIDADALRREIADMQTKIVRPRTFDLIIHPQACVLAPWHVEEEKKLLRVGSTMKGTSAANVEKINRDPQRSPLARDSKVLSAALSEIGAMGIRVHVNEDEYNAAVDRSTLAIVEGAQGYSLGIHRRFWPYTTSRETTPAQVLSDCAIPLASGTTLEVHGCMRTYPIRVANRYDKDGHMLGTSGGHYPDQLELAWDDIGVPPELTTVTQLQRRVFTFSYDQLRAAVRACAPTSLFLNFVNYLKVGDTPQERERAIENMVKQINVVAGREWSAAGNDYTDRPHVDHLGFGPTVEDVRAVRDIRLASLIRYVPSFP